MPGFSQRFIFLLGLLPIQIGITSFTHSHFTLFVSLFERKLDIEEPHIFIFKRTTFLSTIENPLCIWYSSIHLVFYSSSCLKRGILFHSLREKPDIEGIYYLSI